MNKAILVIKQPKSCKDCVLSHISNGLSYCQVLNEFIYEKQQDCPLKPLPQRKPMFYGKIDEITENRGYNKCINEILGETEWE